MCISRMRKPALHWMLPMQKHKVTHLSLMKGATTNCEANEWLSLWVRLTSFDSPIPSSYARQKNMCCQKQTLPIDRAKKNGLTLLRKRSSLRILRRAGITCCRVQKVSTQNLWEVCVHKPFSSLAHSILFGCAEGHSDPPEMFRHRLATSRWRGQCAVGIEPCYTPSLPPG